MRPSWRAVWLDPNRELTDCSRPPTVSAPRGLRGTDKGLQAATLFQPFLRARAMSEGRSQGCWFQVQRHLRGPTDLSSWPFDDKFPKAAMPPGCATHRGNYLLAVNWALDNRGGGRQMIYADKKLPFGVADSYLPY